MRGRPFLPFFIVLALIALTALASALFTVDQTKQAVLLEFGKAKRVVDKPGLHVKLPFVQNVRYFDRRILALDTPPEEVIAADQKRLVVDAFARYRIVDPLKFYQAVGTERGAPSRLAANLNSSLRQVLGSQSFFAVLSGQRGKLMVQIRNRMNDEASRLGVRVVDVRIRRADLPQANSEAIYRRMETAREREAREARAQGAEIAQRIRAHADREASVLLANARRDAEITRGEGDAERSRIYAQAFGQDPEFFRFFRSLQAYQDALKGGTTTFVLSPDSEFFRYLQGPAEGFGRAAPDRRGAGLPELPRGPAIPPGGMPAR